MSSRHNAHNMTSLQNHHSTNQGSSLDQHRPSEQMKTIRSAADAIIRDKDAIIFEYEYLLYFLAHICVIEILIG